MNALVGATMEILGTEFFVEIVKKAEGGYTLLLVPTMPEKPAKKMGNLIDDVKKLIGKDVDTSELQNIVNDANGNETDDFNDIEISLAMAFVYIDKKGENEKTAEYAFQLKADLEGLVPKELEDFVTIKDAFRVSEQEIVLYLQFGGAYTLRILDEQRMLHYHISENGELAFSPQFYYASKSIQIGAYKFPQGMFFCGEVNFLSAIFKVMYCALD